MANFFRILPKKTKADCCTIEIKEVPENPEKNDDCCDGNTGCC